MNEKQARKKCDAWNKKYQPGMKVIVSNGESKDPIKGTTISPADIIGAEGSYNPYVHVIHSNGDDSAWVTLDRVVTAASVDRDSWRTPRPLFDWLHRRFDFTMDACADSSNALRPHYITAEMDILKTRISEDHRVFCNPPYSMDKEIAEHLYDHYLTFGVPSVLLLPVRTDRIWWNRLRTSPGVRVEFYTGRIHFSGAGKGAFMYNCNFIFGFSDVPLVDPIDAGQFNANARGGARK